MEFAISMTGFVALYIFMLAAFAGWVIIGRVPAILHTPLMSGSNFVHGIVVVGGMFALLNASTVLEQAIGFFAVLLGAGNAAGGYAVTDRMLAMFQTSGHKHQTRESRPCQGRITSRRPEETDMFTIIPQLIIGATDLAAAFLFMYGLKRMSSPVTAPSGIFVAGLGMLVAVLASFLYVFGVSAAARPHLPVNIGLAVIALVVGGGVAWWSGKKVAMTSMPQMVALYNGMGGGAAGAIAAVELFGNKAQGVTQLVVTLIGALIGAVSLSGSLIAWAKLDGVIKQPLRVRGQQVFNGAGHAGDARRRRLHRLRGAERRGTADRHAASDLAVFRLRAALRRSDDAADRRRRHAGRDLDLQRLHGSGGRPRRVRAAEPGSDDRRHGGRRRRHAADAADGEGHEPLGQQCAVHELRRRAAKHKQGAIKGSLKPTEAGDAGIFMRYASTVIIVPGYGLAVAQGQQKLYEFVKLLQAAGVEVKFAVHPVAGRMPGQMDVLLAEAGVPYDLIFQLEDINDEFASTDVALVIGANDVVNPAARTDKSSPIFGMPILNADKAKKVYVVKRGEGKGYAGIVNALFYGDNCDMVYGDAQAVLVKMIEAVKRAWDRPPLLNEVRPISADASKQMSHP